MKGSKILSALRIFFGMFMIVVYVGMGVLLAINFFDWKDSITWARWFMAIILALYGVYRAYRQVKGLDYYRLDRFNENEDETEK